jgi:Protein of unknown function (DUF4031)
VIYVDDAQIRASVGGHEPGWSHLFADSQDELLEFADRLGLKREWFQAGTPLGDGRPSPFWHFDVTSGKRERAIQLGPVPWHKAPVIMRERDATAAVPVRPKERHHTWAENGQRQKTCQTCGTVATRRMHPSQKRSITTYTQGGRSFIASRVPACTAELAATENLGSDPPERRELATAADTAAHAAYRAGDLDRAARLIADARVLDPERAETWDTRDHGIREAAARQGRQDRISLQQQTSRRLAAAGIRPDDPGLEDIRSWNRGVGVTGTDREAAP